VKGWIELAGDSSLLYHKKQSLLDNKVRSHSTSTIVQVKG